MFASCWKMCAREFTLSSSHFLCVLSSHIFSNLLVSSWTPLHDKSCISLLYKEALRFSLSEWFRHPYTDFSLEISLLRFESKSCTRLQSLELVAVLYICDIVTPSWFWEDYTCGVFRSFNFHPHKDTSPCLALDPLQNPKEANAT